MVQVSKSVHVELKGSVYGLNVVVGTDNQGQTLHLQLTHLDSGDKWEATHSEDCNLYIE